LPILAQKLSRIGDWGGSNLDANSLQNGSVLNAIQQPERVRKQDSWLYPIHITSLPAGVAGHQS
jgi:hypothetical protein